MRLSAQYSGLLVAVFPALIFLFSGNCNGVFASAGQFNDGVVGTTLTQPGIPRIISGLNTYQPTWTWTASKSLIAGTTHYLVQWCALGDFSGCAQNKMYTDSNSFSFAGASLLTNGMWYMRVQAMDEFGHKSAYSQTGSGTINDFIISAPVNVRADLVGNTVSLGWNDCGGLTFKIWKSTNGESGSYKVVAETQNYTFNTDLGSNGQAWYYLTAYDQWGNESQPSSVIEAGIPSHIEQGQTLGYYLNSIFKPIWAGFGSSDKQNDGVQNASVVPSGSANYLDIFPEDYFKIN